MAPGDEQPPAPEAESPFFGEEVPDERAGRAGLLPEFLRKMAIAGLGAVFMTEEGLRSLAGQLKLPKEVLGFVVSQAEKTKDEVGRVLSEEIRRFLQSEKLRDEFLKLLTGTTVEIKAEIRLVPEKPKPGEAAPPVPVADPAPESAPDAPSASAGPEVVVTEIHARRGKRAKKE